MRRCSRPLLIPQPRGDIVVRKLVSKYPGWGIPTLIALSRIGELVDADARLKVQLLPEEYVKQLEAYDYAEAANQYRADREKNGETVTPAQQEQFVQGLRSRHEATIRDFKKLHEESLKSKPPATQPTWEDLLASFYRWQREQKTK